MRKPIKVLFILFTFFIAPTGFANNPGVSYQGRIFKPDGNPLEGSSVQFRLQVRSPGSENCLLYEEVQTLNMAGSSGVFALTLNDGTGTRLDTATYQVDRIFANRETMTLDSTRCATGTTYTPNSSDGRKLVVYFKDETMAAYEAMPLMNLNYVPQAMYALEAQKIDKFEVNSILRAVDGSGNPATAPALNPTQLTNLNTLLATPAANYVQTTSNGSVALPVVAGNPSNGLAAGQIWYDSGSNVMKYYDGAVKTFGTSSGGVTSVATGTGLTGGPITTTGTINVDVGVTTGKIIQVAASNKLPVIDGSNLTNITATDATKLPLAGGTMTGPLVNNSNSVSTVLAVTQAGAGYAASFMGGNVGIGTASPQRTFHVSTSSNGTPTIAVLENTDTTNNNGINFSFRGVTTSTGATNFNEFGAIQLGITEHSHATQNSAMKFYTRLNGALVMPLSIDATSSVKAHSLIATPAGNVGVGTTSPAAPLDVAGDVKVGNSSASCSTTNKGSIRYNNASSVLEFCNGTSWNLIQAAACSDATPNVFVFTDQSNQTTSTQITSDIVQVSGINCTIPVTVSGVGSPQFQICADSGCSSVVQGWTSSPSSIVSGQYLQLRQTSDAAGGATTQATIIAGTTASIWSVSTAGGDCVGTTPPVGTVCADGTIYAGISPDTSVKMFTTRCDYGQTWNGSACIGSRLPQNWNNGTTNWITTGYSNSNTGKANSAGLFASADAGSAYAAATICENLNQDGHTDWYLPAKNELNILYAGVNTIRNFDTSGTYYWSATEGTAGTSWSQRFFDGFQNPSYGKDTALFVRCARR